MFFADRRVVHQILLAIVDLSLQLFVTGIHPRQHCAAEHYFKGAHHGKAFIGAPGGQRAAAGQIHFYHAYAARQLAFALFNLLKRLRAGVYRQRQGG
ncbi:beta-lactamase SHV-24 domain protein [Acinetobacter baumannii 45052_2]|nr:beta-lactamase SHV-24 domain protein [Acinetobacter baumannii 45052_2]